MTRADKVTVWLSITQAEVRRETYVAVAAMTENRQWD